MSSRVVDVMQMSSAADLQDLLVVLGDVLREAGMNMNDMDTVLLGTQVRVEIIENRLTDGSSTFDLKMVPQETD